MAHQQERLGTRRWGQLPGAPRRGCGPRHSSAPARAGTGPVPWTKPPAGRGRAPGALCRWSRGVILSSPGIVHRRCLGFGSRDKRCPHRRLVSGARVRAAQSSVQSRGSGEGLHPPLCVVQPGGLRDSNPVRRRGPSQRSAASTTGPVCATPPRSRHRSLPHARREDRRPLPKAAPSLLQGQSEGAIRRVNLERRLGSSRLGGPDSRADAHRMDPANARLIPAAASRAAGSHRAFPSDPARAASEPGCTVYSAGCTV
jgi:hypothetical protein